MARDTDALEWAAGNLLKQDWPRKSEDLHRRGLAGLDALSKDLADGPRAREAERLKKATVVARRRDLIIKLSWGGQADLDLRVAEPSKSICSCVNRQTVGGGTLIGDTLDSANAETYVAAEAFKGKYKITVDKVWGRPLGDKAQVQIIEHQGTDKESSKLLTVDLKQGNTVEFELAEGRRTEAAAVPPSSMQQAPEAPGQPETTGNVFAQPRDLAAPEVTVRSAVPDHVGSRATRLFGKSASSGPMPGRITAE